MANSVPLHCSPLVNCDETYPTCTPVMSECVVNHKNYDCDGMVTMPMPKPSHEKSRSSDHRSPGNYELDTTGAATFDYPGTWLPVEASDTSSVVAARVTVDIRKRIDIVAGSAPRKA